MIEFYNVKKKAKVSVDESQVKRVKFEKPTKDGKSVRVRYALKAVDEDGTKLTKFCSQSTYESLS